MKIFKYILIRIVKIINILVIEIEILKYWQYLKVYKILLEKYLREKKLEILI